MKIADTHMKNALHAFRDAVAEMKIALQDENYGGHVMISLRATGYAYHDGFAIKAEVYCKESVSASSLESALAETFRRLGFDEKENKLLLTVASDE